MVSTMRLRLVVCAASCLLLAVPVAAGAYSAEGSKPVEETLEREAKEAAERRANEKTAEQQAKENVEHKEREAKVAEERKTAEERQAATAEQRRHEEIEHAEAEGERKGREAADSQCLVPSLTGDSLGQARKALRAAHCKLGHVTWPPRGHGRHVVRRQNLRAGSKHAAGTAVAVTLAPVKLGR